VSGQSSRQLFHGRARHLLEIQQASTSQLDLRFGKNTVQTSPSILASLTSFMTSFLTRVELHGGSPDDYATLNTAMESAGFSRILRGDSGAPAVYLPTGQYVGNGELTAAQVSQLAQGAALKTKKGFAVFVTDSTTAAWFGLEPVPAAAIPA
jgi:hypothetical protein